MKHQSSQPSNMSYSTPVGSVEYNDTGASPVAAGAMGVVVFLVVVAVIVLLFFLFAWLLMLTYNASVAKMFAVEEITDFWTAVWFSLFVIILGFFFTPTTGVIGGISRSNGNGN